MNSNESTTTHLGGIAKKQHLLWILIGVFHCWDYTSPRGVPFWAESAAIFVFMATILCLVQSKGVLPTRPLVYATCFGLFFSIIALLPPLPPISYLLGDFALFAVVPLLIWVGLRNSELEDIFKFLIPLCALAAFIAPIFEDFWELGTAYRNGRYDPPSVLLVTYFAYMTLHNRSVKSAAFALCGFLVVCALCFYSQERTAVIFCIVALGLAAASLTHSILTIALVSIISIFTLSYSLLPALGNVSIGRFSLLVGGLDQSMINRIWEGYDVWSTLENGHVLHWLVGYGHGAIFQSVWAETTLNMSNTGTIHNIHFGPLLILYRYGAIGLVIAATITIKIVSFLIRTIRVRNDYDFVTRRTKLIFGTSAALLILEFNLRNVFNDPLSWLVVLYCMMQNSTTASGLSGRQ